MVFPYNVVMREIPGRVGKYLFWTWFFVYIAQLLMEVKMGFMDYDFLLFISSAYMIVAEWVVVYVIPIMIGGLLAYYATQALTFIVGLVGLNEGENWIIFIFLYAMLAFMEIDWTISLVHLISILCCALVSTITQAWPNDGSGFINNLMMVYLTLLYNKHEAELWYILMVIGVSFYSKVTESLLKRLLLWFGIGDDADEHPRTQLVNDDDDDNNNNNSISISISIGIGIGTANELRDNVEEEKQRVETRGETERVEGEREQQGQSQ